MNMKKVNFILLLLAITTCSFSQSGTARLSVKADVSLTPGDVETMNVTVTNISASTFVNGKSEYSLVIHYDGSTNAGEVFNQTIRLPKPIQAGGSYTFSTISFKSPIYPGTYPVDISFRWGNRIISQTERINFMVAAKYEASLSVSRLSFPGEAETDLQFTVTNTGRTGWPDGASYSLRFELRRSPSAALREDKDRFNFAPRVLEKWDMEPGESEAFNLRDFQLPRVSGDYVVKVHLLSNGKAFDAEGATREFTFRVGR